MEKYSRKKPIVELDKPGGKIKKYWESAKQAADAYNMNQVIISYNVRGTTKQAKGHYFRFATKKEVEQYSNIINIIDEEIITDTTPIVTDSENSNIPVETIPEVVNRDENQVNTLSPFEQLLEASKNKLTENSK